MAELVEQLDSNDATNVKQAQNITCHLSIDGSVFCGLHCDIPLPSNYASDQRGPHKVVDYNGAIGLVQEIHTIPRSSVLQSPTSKVVKIRDCNPKMTRIRLSIIRS